MPFFKPGPPRRKKGSALILFVLLLIFVLIPMIGLAIDGTLGYLTQTRLSVAVDAAALAGARSLSTGLDIASQQASALNTIKLYLQANLPTGLYDTYDLASTSSIQESSYKTRTVTVSATVNYPLYFLQIFGKTYATVAASGQASRRDVNMILTIDRSGSMQGTPCRTMKIDAQAFADGFTNGRDRIGLATFKASAHLDFAPSLTFKTDSPNLDSVIASVACAGSTGSAQALWLAYQQILAINQPGALNLIVYLTDGQPNGIAAHFPVKNQIDVRYDAVNTSSLVTTPASSCKVSGAGVSYLDGVLSQGAGDGAVLGYTTGLMDRAGTPISTTADPLIAAPGCAFLTNSAYVRRDIAYIPTTDLWGNSTLGYKTVDTFPPGNPFGGQMRVDEPIAVVYASTNAADDAARRIRSDSQFVPIIYSIGLGGDGWIDHDFLRRVANDPQASNYNPKLPAGLYVYSPDSSQLASALNTIRSQILRLAK